MNQAELDYIAAGGGLGQQRGRTRFEWRNIGFLLRQRQILGASIGQFAGNSTLVFFLTWFPTYLATERQMGWLKVGFYRGAAVHRRVGRRAGRRLRLGHAPATHRLGERSRASCPIITGLRARLHASSSRTSSTATRS